MNDGGPAFPSKTEKYIKNPSRAIGEYVPVFNLGMTLRDYLAAKAMQAHLSCESTINHPAYSFEGVAAASYQVADAMLKAREETK